MSVVTTRVKHSRLMTRIIANIAQLEQRVIIIANKAQLEQRVKIIADKSSKAIVTTRNYMLITIHQNIDTCHGMK